MANIPIQFIENNNLRDLSVYFLEIANQNFPEKDKDNNSTLKAGAKALFTWKE
jgi:hypothetical protein